MFRSFLAERLFLSSIVLCALFTSGIMMVQTVAPWVSNSSCEQLAFASNQSGNWDIYLLDVPSKIAINLTHSPDHEEYAFWSPDGQQLAYTVRNMEISIRETIVVQNIETGDLQRYSYLWSLYDSLPRFSADGQSIITGGWQTPEQMINLRTHETTIFANAVPQTFNEIDTNHSADNNQPLLQLLFMPSKSTTQVIFLNGDGERQIISLDGAIFTPNLSPDSRCIAYMEGRFNSRNVYMIDLATGNEQLLLDTSGDYNSPVWRPHD
jgi:Tol biopolymer transport system component